MHRSLAIWAFTQSSSHRTTKRSKQGLQNIALVGVSKDNTGDALKQQAFNDYKRIHGNESNLDIYYFDASLKECLDRFLLEREK